jgi:Flp pilus assembly protein TadG
VFPRGADVTTPVISGNRTDLRQASPKPPRGGPALLGRLFDDRSGASAIVLALSLSTVLGSAGLAVDAGLWYSDKRSVQNVADLAAWTALQTYNGESETGSAATDAKNAALAVATANGFKNGSNGVSVTVHNPPSSGPNTGNANAFEVIITKPENMFFSSPYLKSVTVAGRAVAGVTTVTTGGGSPGCIFSKTDITINGSVAINAPSCAIYADGTVSSALSMNGSATIDAGGVYVVGGISKNGSVSITSNPPPVTGASPTPDPYASETISNAETGYNVNCSGSSGGTSYNGSSSVSLNPGVFCGGLSFNGSMSATLNPGVYIIYGGSFSVNGSVSVTGTGVTIVLTGSSGNYASYSVNGSATFAISSPATGPTAGLAVFSDPNNTSPATINGSSGLTVNGAMYFPGQAVTFNGSDTNSNAVCTQLDADSITYNGSVNYNANCAAYGTKQIGGTSTTTTLSMLE